MKINSKPSYDFSFAIIFSWQRKNRPNDDSWFVEDRLEFRASWWKRLLTSRCPSPASHATAAASSVSAPPPCRPSSSSSLERRAWVAESWDRISGFARAESERARSTRFHVTVGDLGRSCRALRRFREKICFRNRSTERRTRTSKTANFAALDPTEPRSEPRTDAAYTRTNPFWRSSHVPATDASDDGV